MVKFCVCPSNVLVDFSVLCDVVSNETEKGDNLINTYLMIRLCAMDSVPLTLLAGKSHPSLTPSLLAIGNPRLLLFTSHLQWFSDQATQGSLLGEFSFFMRVLGSPPLEVVIWLMWSVALSPVFQGSPS